MAPSPYVADERVLCFHHEILYEAKILEVQHQDPADRKSPFKYRVHYKGWKNTWDDWVVEDRLRKLTDENRELATHIRREAESSQRLKNAKGPSKKRAMSDRSSVRDSEERGNSTSGRPNKRVRENDIEKEEHFQARPTIRIVMPDNLKALLVDDWERVTKNFSVVKLPAPRPIREILQAYRADEVPQRNRFDLQVLDTNLAGLTEYFEVAIGKVLLYNYERHQYRLLRKKYKGIKGKSPVNIFGAEHLIRMFSNLGELLAQTNLGYQSTGRVQREVSKLAIWLSHRSDTYFRTAYIPAYGLTSDDV